MGETPTPPHPRRDELSAVFARDRFAASLGAVLEEWGPGWARLSWTPTDEHCNFAGSVHGGALFSVADAGFAVACNSWGRLAVALSVDVHFLGEARVGEALTITARERSRTRRTGSYHLDVHAGRRHVASLHAMAFRTGRWHLDEDDWPEDWRSLA